jgi:hypothetical protein
MIPRLFDPRLLGCCFLSAVFAAGAAAETGDRISLPSGNLPPKHGLRMTVDTRWIDANGYRPVRVEAISWPPGPSPADRTLRVVLRAQHYHTSTATTAVTQSFELPQGAAVARTTVAVPQDYDWSSLSVEVYEGGARLDDLCETHDFAYRGFVWSESAPAVLIIAGQVLGRDQRAKVVQRWRGSSGNDPVPDRTLPDIRPLIVRFLEVHDYQMLESGDLTQLAGSDLDTLTSLQQSGRIEMLPFGELPERWIDYTMFDLICIRLDELAELVQQHPGRWRAVRDWLVSGTTLCVYRTAVDAEGLAYLDRLLDLPRSAEASGQPSAADGWHPPRATDRGQTLQGWPLSGLRVWRDASVDEALPAAVADAAASEAETLFVIRRAGLGRVVAIDSQEPFREDGNHFSRMFNEIRPENWMWQQRHGISLHRENSEYWNWNVPGVGRAPVGSYLLLISLFVIVIGPVNYYCLRKWKRLYLLLVTVPLGAALVTAALLNYALLTDGLGVRVRVRSFTHLDQRDGQVASWSRQSYYAGLAPSRGLRFPETVALYPIRQDPTEGRRHRGQHRLLWDDGQHLLSGYVTSRATAQFLVVQSGRSDRLLAVHSDAAAAAPSVENRLGADLRWLVLRDADGRFFRGEALAAGQRSGLQPVEPVAAAAELQRWYDGCRPEFPEGYDAHHFHDLFGASRRHYYWRTIDQNVMPPSLNQSILERQLRIHAHSGLDSLPHRSYLAVTDQGVEVPLGHPHLREEASFHLIQGRW